MTQIRKHMKISSETSAYRYKENEQIRNDSCEVNLDSFCCMDEVNNFKFQI